MTSRKARNASEVLFETNSAFAAAQEPKKHNYVLGVKSVKKQYTRRKSKTEWDKKCQTQSGKNGNNDDTVHRPRSVG